MRPHHRTLNRQQVHRSTATFLQKHLPLCDYKRSVTSDMLWSVLLATAALVGSLHSTCQWLSGLPSEETLRQAVYNCIPDYDTLRRQLNDALAGRLPRALRRRRQRLAIDLTLIPYHGEPYRKSEELYRCAAKSGTTHFHAYATAYVVSRGRRFTVALSPVPRGTSMTQVVKDLVRQTASAGIKPSLVLLDRGFYAAEVVRYLQHARLPFVMPVKLTGRKADHPKGPSGTCVFTTETQSGWHAHTIESGTRRARVRICVYYHKTRARKTLIYACWGIGEHSCDWVQETYRTRFGIEAGYRQMHQALGQTTSRRPELRLLYVGLSLLLRNEWVWLHWEVLSKPRRGCRRLQPGRLRLGVLLCWVREAIEQKYGTITEVETERDTRALLM